MAGSQTWRTYIADNGDRFSVNINKALASGLFKALYANLSTEVLFPSRLDDYPPLPKGYKMRYLNMRSSLPDVSRKRLNIRVPFGNAVIIQQLTLEFATVQFDKGVYATGTYYDVSSYQGEYRLIDVGSLQIDG